MSKPYIPQPSVEVVMRQLAIYLSQIYRVKIIYTIQHTNGNYECNEIANPDDLGRKNNHD
jgi:hypothetical protein